MNALDNFLHSGNRSLGYTRGMADAAEIAWKNGHHELAQLLRSMSFRSAEFADLDFNERRKRLEVVS